MNIVVRTTGPLVVELWRQGRKYTWRFSSNKQFGPDFTSAKKAKAWLGKDFAYEHIGERLATPRCDRPNVRSASNMTAHAGTDLAELRKQALRKYVGRKEEAYGQTLLSASQASGVLLRTPKAGWVSAAMAAGH